MHPSEEAESFRDRRLKARKLNNWRKRYRDELQLGTFALGSTCGRIQGAYLLLLDEKIQLTIICSQSYQ
jgi:hypothetical protein